MSALLDATGDPDRAVAEIASVPALVEEARASLPALKAVATAKAGPDGVRAVIGKRVALYPQPERSEAEWNAWWADYIDVLADVPLASLEAGMRAYVADPASEFMPKPGRLRELAFTAPCRSLGRFYRAQRAVDLADKPVALPVEKADADAVKRLLDDYSAKCGRGASDKPLRYAMPSTAGKPDEGGLTPEMRKLIARRQAEQASAE